MKKLYTILTACLFLAYLGSCQNEETEQEAVGYLMLQVGTDKTTLTKTQTDCRQDCKLRRQNGKRDG